jgi:hypothetical protein
MKHILNMKIVIGIFSSVYKTRHDHPSFAVIRPVRIVFTAGTQLCIFAMVIVL